MIGFIRPRLHPNPPLASITRCPVRMVVRLLLRICLQELFHKYPWKTRSTKQNASTGNSVRIVLSPSKARTFLIGEVIAVGTSM